MATPSWLDRLLPWRHKAPPPPPPPTNVIVEAESWIIGRPQGPDDFDRRKLVDEGYRKNVVVYACVNEIAQTAPSAPLIVRDRATLEPIEEGPLVELLANPSPDMTLQEVLEIALIHQQTAGVGYLHKGRNGAGEVVELRPLRPDRMFPIPGRNGRVESYEYRLSGQTKGTVVPATDVVELKLADPLNDYHGLSPLMVAAIWGDIDADAAAYLRDFFSNGAVPLGILKAKAPRVLKDQADALRAEWRATVGRGEVGGRSKWHEIAVMGSDVEYQAIGAEPGVIKMDPMWGMSETRICAAFGVPVTIVGFKVGMTSGTLSDGTKNREARRTFWTETLVPLDRRLAGALTRGIAMEFDLRYQLAWDFDRVPELQEDLDLRAARASKLYTSGLTYFNEARKAVGLEEAPQDYLFVPSGGKLMKREEVESGTLPEPPPPPPQFAPRALPPGEPQPSPEGQAWNGHEVQGVSVTPKELGPMLDREASRMDRGFTAAVEAGIAASDEAALRAALAARDRKAAERAVGVAAFASRYAEELERHLVRVAEEAQRVYYRHHGRSEREAHALRDLPRAVADDIRSRVKTEAARFGKEGARVVRAEILAVVNGKQDRIRPQDIVHAIGLSERQHDQLMRQFERLVLDPKVSVSKLEKEIDKFRAKLLRERSELIAQHETRLAQGLGQRAAWEEMLRAGDLKGGRRAWLQQWVVEDDDRLCPICEELDGETTPIGGTFGDEGFAAPPDPHLHCRCRVVLVRASDVED